MTVEEVKLTKEVLEQLISFSEDWEKENSCHGYQKNTLDDIKGNRIFLAVENDIIMGYLFGHDLHFYIDELGMEFWSARLFQRIR